MVTCECTQQQEEDRKRRDPLTAVSHTISNDDQAARVLSWRSLEVIIINVAVDEWSSYSRAGIHRISLYSVKQIFYYGANLTGNTKYWRWWWWWRRNKIWGMECVSLVEWRGNKTEYRCHYGCLGIIFYWSEDETTNGNAGSYYALCSIFHGKRRINYVPRGFGIAVGEVEAVDDKWCVYQRLEWSSGWHGGSSGKFFFVFCWLWLHVINGVNLTFMLMMYFLRLT